MQLQRARFIRQMHPTSFCRLLLPKRESGRRREAGRIRLGHADIRGHGRRMWRLHGSSQSVQRVLQSGRFHAGDICPGAIHQRQKAPPRMSDRSPKGHHIQALLDEFPRPPGRLAPDGHASDEQLCRGHFCNRMFGSEEEVGTEDFSPLLLAVHVGLDLLEEIELKVDGGIQRTKFPKAYASIQDVFQICGTGTQLEPFFAIKN